MDSTRLIVNGPAVHFPLPIIRVIPRLKDRISGEGGVCCVETPALVENGSSARLCGRTRLLLNPKTRRVTLEKNISQVQHAAIDKDSCPARSPRVVDAPDAKQG